MFLEIEIFIIILKLEQNANNRAKQPKKQD